MENLKPLEEEGKQEDNQETEEMKPMPFGLIGIHILCNITQYAVFVGLTVGVIALIKVFGPK